MPNAGNLTVLTRINPITGELYPVENRRKVFISYKKQDGEGFRDLIAAKILDQADVAVWYDEQGIQNEKEYADEIRETIADCDAFVLLITQSLTDPSCEWDTEVRMAMERNKGIIPIACNIASDACTEAEKKLENRAKVLTLTSNKESCGTKLHYIGRRKDRDFDQSLGNALERFVADVNLAERVKAFFASDHGQKNEVFLNNEDLFLKGVGYLTGIGTEMDEAKGERFLSKLAMSTDRNADNPEKTEIASDSAMELVKYYIKKNESDKMKPFITIAEHSKNPMFLRTLGLLYSEGIYTGKNLKKAVELLGRSAKLSYAPSIVSLGDLYDNVEGDKKYKEKAAELYKKAADMGDAQATFILGEMNQNGEGVEPDKAKASELYQKASDMGNAKASFNLGVMYYNGEGVAQDKAKAVELLQEASDMYIAHAAYSLAILYVNGEGVAQDKAKAAVLFRKASDMGHANATFDLGLMNYYGDGVAQDKANSAGLFRKAADLGHAGATFNLGVMYDNGEGVEQNKTKASEQYRKAADLGHAGATFNLGVMYDNGDGVEQDRTKAAELYQKAADLGHAGGIYNLGIMVYYGEGTEQDEAKALELIEKAAEMGWDDARKSLTILKK